MDRITEPNNKVNNIIGMYVDIMPGDKELFGRVSWLKSNRHILPGMVRGILQDDLNVAFTSSWTDINSMETSAQTTSTLLNSAGAIAGSAGKEGSKSRAFGSAAKGVANAMSGITGFMGNKDGFNKYANAVGLGWGNMGPAITKIYNSTSMENVRVKLKWYMPGAEADVIKNLMLLIFCIYPAAVYDSAEIKGLMDTAAESAGEDGGISLASLGQTVINLGDSLQKTVSSYSATYFIPPMLKLRIADWLTLSPVIMRSLNLSMSRFTYDCQDMDVTRQMPVFITADMSFEYAQNQLLNGTYLNDRDGAEALSILGMVLSGQKSFNYRDISR